MSRVVRVEPLEIFSEPVFVMQRRAQVSTVTDPNTDIMDSKYSQQSSPQDTPFNNRK